MHFGTVVPIPDDPDATFVDGCLEVQDQRPVTVHGTLIQPVAVSIEGSGEGAGEGDGRDDRTPAACHARCCCTRPCVRSYQIPRQGKKGVENGNLGAADVESGSRGSGKDMWNSDSL